MSITVGSLFTGVGMFDAAFERAGCHVVWQVEKDATARSVLRRHWPDTALHEDVCEVGKHNLEPVDIIIGGFPCQGLSVAGLRKGLADERSNLFFEMLRVIDELQPAAALWENVPGLRTACSCRECGRRCATCGTLSGDDTECGVCGGEKFRGRVLPHHSGADFFAVVSSLGYIGMDGAWSLLDAQWFGLAQRRQRLFGVFTQRHLGADSAIEILSFANRLSGHPQTRRKAGQGVTGRTQGGAGEGGVVAATLQGGGRDGHRLDAESAAGGHLISVARSLTASNTRLNGDADNFICVTGEQTHALSSEGADASEDGTGRGTPLAVSLRGREGGATAELGGEQMPALRAAQGGGDKPHVLAFAWQQGDDSGNNPNGRGRSYIVRAGDYAGAVSATRVDAIAGPAFGVRRLTPRECERLMGLPDDFTRYAADGTEISDSARYRLIGNGGAVPVVQWIAERMVSALELRDAA